MDDWHLVGNAGTDPAANFLGTTDNRPLIFKTNLHEAMRIEPDGDIGVGVTAPTARLAVFKDDAASGGVGVSSQVVNGRRETAAIRGTCHDGHGVIGSSNLGAGVEGLSQSGNGVFGDSGMSGVVGKGYVGIVGMTQGHEGDYAGFFFGDVEVTGTLAKGGGWFKIDHPLDPANKYLYHAFVESEDMKNFYDGLVELDEHGAATVELPSWFEALNRDLRYQLTPIGRPCPDLHVATEVSSGRFSIAGGSPKTKVSWQVTGTRCDRWAEAYRIATEVDKPKTEQGRYLHPELFGEAAADGIGPSRLPRELLRSQSGLASTPHAAE